MKRWVPIALVCCSCATVSESALIVRDGTVSAGADAAMIQGASDLAQGLQRVEQDQLVALAVLNKTSTCELRAQVAQARADWQEAFAVVGLAKAVQAPFLLREGGDEIAHLTRDLEIGEVFDWKIPVPQPKEGTHFTATALVMDATPMDNAVPWIFTQAALKLEPLLPLDQQRHRSNPNTPDLTAVQAAQPVKVDGDLGEWKDAPCYDANRADQVSFGDPAQWGGPQDLSGRVCYAWDAQNLYVAFRVWDDQIVQVNRGANLWQGDHVELWFDTQLQLDFDADQAGEDDFQIGISPGDFKSVKPDFYIFTPAGAQERAVQLPSIDEVEYAVARTPDGYTGEIKLPAAALRGLRLSADNTIGVSFEPSDTDTPGSSAQELMLSLAPKSSGAWGNPTNWNNLTLKAAEAATVTPAP